MKANKTTSNDIALGIVKAIGIILLAYGFWYWTQFLFYLLAG
jgi:hypothetical protein